MNRLPTSPFRLLRVAAPILCLGAVAGVVACGAGPSSSEDVGSSAEAIVGSHPTFPQVPDQSGQILVAPRLVTIVASNDTSTGTDSATNLQNFSDALPSSSVWAAVSSEYGVGALSSAAHLTGKALTGTQTKAALQTYVEGVVAADGYAPNGKTIYLVYIPTAASLSTTDFGTVCGEHFQYPSTATDAIAVVRRCTPEQTQETQLGQMTRDASHEIVEASTNPRQGGYNFNASVVPGVSSVWSIWNGGDVELADLCQGTRIFQTIGAKSPSGGWEFQRVWSNKAAALGGDPCVPTISDPYYSVSVPSGWYAATPGETLSIPVTGWSASTTGNWFLNRDVSTAAASTSFASSDAVITSSLGISSPAGCGARYAMNASDTATLTVTVPSTAKAGDYAVFLVTSFDETASLCNPTMAQDFQHFWPVGVYLPASAGESCGGSTVCGSTTYCSYPTGDTCGATGAGTCETRPRICPYIVLPVCGCNGLTYGNGCFAEEAGTSVAHGGHC
jgi:Kazal-type serine protease inhibitor domain